MLWLPPPCVSLQHPPPSLTPRTPPPSNLRLPSPLIPACRAAAASSRHVVVLEIGCGYRVPTIRAESEAILAALGPRATHVRVNMELPLPPSFAEGGGVGGAAPLGSGGGRAEHGTPPYRTISIMAGGLEALTKMDAVINRAMEDVMR